MQMNESKAWPENCFTDAPAPRRGLLTGTLQLVFWVFFHPSAWANHIRQIDPALPQAVCLLDLGRWHWRSPNVRRLLLQVLLIFPLFVLVVSWPLILLQGKDPYDALAHSITNLGYVFASLLGMSIAVSLPAGMAYCLSMGVILALLPIGVHSADTTLAVSGAAALAGSTQIVFTTNTVERPLTKRLASLTVGLVVPTLVLLVAYFLVQAAAQPAGETPRLGANISASQAALSSVATMLVLALAGFGILLLRNSRRLAAAGLFASLFAFMISLSLLLGLLITPESLILFLTGSIGGGLLFPFFFAFGYILSSRIAGGTVACVVGTVAGGWSWVVLSSLIFSVPIDAWNSFLVSIPVMLLGLTFHVWRPWVTYAPFMIWNTLLYVIDSQRNEPRRLHLHAAFWDELQRLPWYALDDHLLLMQSPDPRINEWLVRHQQPRAVRQAQMELTARKMGECRNIEMIAAVHHQTAPGLLPGPASMLLQEFNQLSRDVEAALQQVNELHSRTMLGEIRDRLQHLNNELLLSKLKYAHRFIPVSDNWLHILGRQLDRLSMQAVSVQSIPNPYIYGSPLNASQKIFVGRVEILSRLQQMIQDGGHAPVMIYGQRRMGKTSLLLNLGRILPSRILPSFIDCQYLAGSSDYVELMYSIAQQICSTAEQHTGCHLPAMSLARFSEQAVLNFDEWLNIIESQLERNNQYLLVKMDEIEELNAIFSQPGFPPEPFFNSLRHTIQHRPRFKVVLASSHTLGELQHWSSYLINTQLIKLGFLEAAEARQLIERPIPNFPLRWQPEAVQHLLDLTRAHPHLVQMLCYELVTLKNSRPVAERYLAGKADVEQAAERALETGGFFFADIRRQASEKCLGVLNELAQRGAQGSLSIEEGQALCGVGFEENLKKLLQRDIIEPCAGGYRFQVEMVRRWFAANRA